MPDRPQKMTFAEMRDMGVRGLLIYCADYRCAPREATLAATFFALGRGFVSVSGWVLRTA
jgi:hypothetical protein